MSRTMMRSALAFVVVAAAAVYFTARTSGQSSGTASMKDHDWLMYNADLRGTRYSPLDQINGSNFTKLEVAWRFKTDNLGSRPEFKLEGTPLVVKGILYATGGTRRSVFALDGRPARCSGCMRSSKASAAPSRRASCRAAASRTGLTAKATSASSTSRPATAWSR